MEDNEVLLRAVDTITEKPIQITIPVVNKSLSAWDRLLIHLGAKAAPEKEKIYQVTDLYCGSMERVSARAINIPPDVLKTNISRLIVEGSGKYLPDFIYIAAVGLTNREEEPPEELIRFLRWNCSMKKIFEIVDATLSKSNYQAFISTTVLIKGADVLSVPETDAPTAMEPEDKSGQLAGETIAHGQ